jgi:phosphopantothenate---cysteine ligase (CTP)
MNCLVTAGPTYEPLDEVRRLTNFSTGRLGSELANYFADHGHDVTLLLGEQATWRAAVNAQVQPFTTTADLRDRLHAAGKGKFDAVFHAAAVSDFGFGKVWQRDEKRLRPVESGKIPTDLTNVLVELVPTPKIIGSLRLWFPEAFIVGWKYEVDGDRDSVLAKARMQIAGNNTNACVANGAAYGKGFGVVRGSGKVTHANTAAELYAVLSNLLKP